MAVYICLFIVVVCHGVQSVTYTAGVVEFAADALLPTESPPELILRNARRYCEIISTAATHGVDILVFPECGLTSIAIPIVRDKIPPYVTEIPNIGANPCDLPNAPKVLQMLSCSAREGRLYIVFNLDELVHCPPDQPDCPADGSLFYNTNVALDRNGTIVAKYRKFNLFVEPEFNVTKEPEHSWFESDFGVRFGMFICFDILFKEPTYTLLSHMNISNFVYSTAWFSELPFLTAISVQSGWAYVNDVNLLASGYSNTTNKNAGSGIYAGRDGRLRAIMPEHSTTKLLIARVSSDQRRVSPSPTEEITFTEDTNSALDFFHDILTNFTTVLLTGNSEQLDYKNEGFICNIHTDFSIKEKGPMYRLVAFSGLRSYGLVRTVRIEVCGIIACADSKLSSCGHSPLVNLSKTVFSKISISASSDKSLLSYPITLDRNLLSFPAKDFQFRLQQEKNGGIDMSMVTENSVSNLITFALFRNGMTN